jgi:glycosyltransferase involved in cell wall biosynthesis
VTVPGAAPVRLLKVVPTLLCGGTETQFMTLARSLDPDRFQLAFTCLRRWGPFVDELADRRIPLREYRISSFRSMNALAQQARFAWYVASERVQIVHSYNFYGNVFAIPPARLAAAPVVIASIRDRGPYLTPMQKRVQRYVCKAADCVLVNADAVKDWLVADKYDPATIVVIRNGVDLSRFSEPPDPDRVRREFGLPPGVPLVAVVSRLIRLKGLEYFLEAAALIAARLPTVRFAIVGEATKGEYTYRPMLEQLAERLGIRDRVVFAGLRSDVPALLGGVTVSVMPSLDEALSNVVLESMAAGAPTVATRVGGTPEAIVDGVTGLLVPPANALALAGAIERLLDDTELATRLGRAARQSIQERFTVERMVRATEQLYLDLLARKLKKPLPAWLTAHEAVGRTGSQT